MGFDGIPRPAQVNPYTDPMNPYMAANSAKSDRAGKPLVKELNKEEQVKALYREQPQHHDADDEQEHEPFSEEEEEQIRLFAKMRGIMDFSLKTGARYEFHINAQSGMVDLIDLESGDVVLQLQPEELLQLSQKIQRYAGMLTDRSG
jgi:flagellar protein FlaG